MSTNNRDTFWTFSVIVLSNALFWCFLLAVFRFELWVGCMGIIITSCLTVFGMSAFMIEKDD